MRHGFGLDIPENLADVCDPARMALVIYDMQAGIVGQLPDGPEIVARVGRLLGAARRGGYRVFFTRHMSLPANLSGVMQLRTAMAWQQVGNVDEVRPWFLRDSPGFPIVPELAPRPDEAIFDKITMSAFEGTPLNIALRDCGIVAFAIAGIALEIGIGPSVWHGADLGFVPVVVTDACGGRDQIAQKRVLDAMEFAGDTMLTDLDTITRLLTRNP
jgi:nicotinamidase-related amidase